MPQELQIRGHEARQHGVKLQVSIRGVHIEVFMPHGEMAVDNFEKALVAVEVFEKAAEEAKRRDK